MKNQSSSTHLSNVINVARLNLSKMSQTQMLVQTVKKVVTKITRVKYQSSITLLSNVISKV